MEQYEPPEKYPASVKQSEEAILLAEERYVELRDKAGEGRSDGGNGLDNGRLQELEMSDIN